MSKDVFLPCLLERWSNISDGAPVVRSPASSWHDVRRDVIRNLEWLLNTEAPHTFAGRTIPQTVKDSVLCFGIDAYSGQAQSTLRPDDIAWSIRNRIVTFEPRIDPYTLEIRISDDTNHHHFNKLKFSVFGYLRADPLPIEFIVQMQIDTESGQSKVTG